MAFIREVLLGFVKFSAKKQIFGFFDYFCGFKKKV